MTDRRVKAKLKPLRPTKQLQTARRSSGTLPGRVQFHQHYTAMENVIGFRAGSRVYLCASYPLLPDSQAARCRSSEVFYALNSRWLTSQPRTAASDAERTYVYIDTPGQRPAVTRQQRREGVKLRQLSAPEGYVHMGRALLVPEEDDPRVCGLFKYPHRSPNALVQAGMWCSAGGYAATKLCVSAKGPNGVVLQWCTTACADAEATDEAAIVYSYEYTLFRPQSANSLRSWFVQQICRTCGRYMAKGVHPEVFDRSILGRLRADDRSRPVPVEAYSLWRPSYLSLITHY